jgi:hypothetical protein
VQQLHGREAPRDGEHSRAVPHADRAPSMEGLGQRR